MKTQILIPGFLAVTLICTGQSSLQITPFIQQSAMYYSSPRITAEGIGTGAGVMFDWQRNLFLQTDVNIYWGNGNAFKAHLGAGYQRKGNWSPSMMATIGVIWGQRTEILSETGLRPDWPLWNAGLRIAPLRFKGEHGFVSALEFGYGIGPDEGTCLEATILSVGRRF
jgi:hypothetical protein